MCIHNSINELGELLAKDEKNVFIFLGTDNEHDVGVGVFGSHDGLALLVSRSLLKSAALRSIFKKALGIAESLS